MILLFSNFFRAVINYFNSDHPFSLTYFLKCVFVDFCSWVSSYAMLNWFYCWMHKGIGYSCGIYHHCASPCASSSEFIEKRHINTDCICEAWFRCVFSYVRSCSLNGQQNIGTGCICKVYLRCGFSYAPSYDKDESKHIHNDRIWGIFLHYVFAYAA